MHKLKSVLKNVTHKILWDFKIQIDLWDFKIQIDPQIPARRRNQMIKKENLPYSGLCRPRGQQSENKKNVKRNKYLDPPRKLRKLWNEKVTAMLIIIGTLGTVYKVFERSLEK